MAKKSFRMSPSIASECSRPAYPTLNDLRPSALRRWGLAAVGSLLLTGCWRTAGVPVPANRPEQIPQVQGGAAGAAGVPDAAPAPIPQYEPPTGGVPPMTRLEEERAIRREHRWAKPANAKHTAKVSKQGQRAK
jgi:hypothetical protein